jgi:hypothetical protein
MGKADFHRRWAGRLLRLAAGAQDPAVKDQLRLMAADSLEKAARFEREAEGPPVSPPSAVVEGSEGRLPGENPPDEPPSGSEKGF